MKKFKFSTLLVIVFVFSFFLYGCSGNTSARWDPNSSNSVSSSSEFPDWNEDSEAINQLTDFVSSVTDEQSKDFVPVEDRIAVFDLDGTLYCETYPIYSEWLMFTERALNDPTYQATDEMKSTAEEILEAGKTGKISDELEKKHAELQAKAFAGMTTEEYSNYVRNFLDTPAAGFENLQKKDAFYIPMKEVVSYLQNNNFTVYIVSGTDRIFVRTAIENVLDIPERQVIGMDVNLIASGQGNTDGLDYVFKDSDTVVRGDKMIIKNVKMNKVSQITQEIGQQPVLSFGNSSGDISMAEYVTTNNPYPSAAFMLVNDDTEREHGNLEKSQKSRETFESYGWNIISMKNDFTRIYPDDVKVTK